MRIRRSAPSWMGKPSFNRVEQLPGKGCRSDKRSNHRCYEGQTQTGGNGSAHARASAALTCAMPQCMAQRYCVTLGMPQLAVDTGGRPHKAPGLKGRHPSEKGCRSDKRSNHRCYEGRTQTGENGSAHARASAALTCAMPQCMAQRYCVTLGMPQLAVDTGGRPHRGPWPERSSSIRKGMS